MDLHDIKEISGECKVFNCIGKTLCLWDTADNAVLCGFAEWHVRLAR